MDNSNQSWETIALVRMHESVTHDLCPLTASWVYNECNSCTIERITFKFLKRRKKVFCDECLVCFSLFFNCCNDYFILNSDFVLNFLQLCGAQMCSQYEALITAENYHEEMWSGKFWKSSWVYCPKSTRGWVTSDVHIFYCNCDPVELTELKFSETTKPILTYNLATNQISVYM